MPSPRPEPSGVGAQVVAAWWDAWRDRVFTEPGEALRQLAFVFDRLGGPGAGEERPLASMRLSALMCAIPDPLRASILQTIAAEREAEHEKVFRRVVLVCSEACLAHGAPPALLASFAQEVESWAQLPTGTR